MVNVYNWSDYIAEDTIANFEKETGIKVVYDVYDSNEVLEAKLLAGKSGYDVIFPTARPFAARHIQSNLYAPLDKTKLANSANLDANILNSLTDIDPGNAHALPYMWGTTGLGYNVDKVKAALGADAPLDTWALVFNPETAAKLASCGISLMDDEVEVMSAALAYLGKNPNSIDPADIDAAAALLTSVRPHIKYFHSSQYINDLANGDTCVSHGYSGDVLQARTRAAEAKNGVNVAYAVPKEGAVVWTDVMAIPADAPHVDNAHTFINFIMRPEVTSAISNFVSYANANTAATPMVDEAIRTDVGIYPPAETMAKLFRLESLDPEGVRLRTSAWTHVKAGQ
ncbi:MAG: spermidine/putrescine ABC transporter substrate-binding protein PotF [Alphaproteobacteria bacterium RIFOXYD12_FULL_60_8]|nr:MAG: spermidine/putrescine ABC transporter substrate-binding protein PotF [Alphaproteobacteria bacterium RIFOXYD12_FULL_60_8]